MEKKYQTMSLEELMTKVPCRLRTKKGKNFQEGQVVVNGIHVCYDLAKEIYNDYAFNPDILWTKTKPGESKFILDLLVDRGKYALYRRGFEGRAETAGNALYHLTYGRIPELKGLSKEEIPNILSRGGERLPREIRDMEIATTKEIEKHSLYRTDEFGNHPCSGVDIYLDNPNYMGDFSLNRFEKYDDNFHVVEENIGLSLNFTPKRKIDLLDCERFQFDEMRRLATDIAEKYCVETDVSAVGIKDRAGLQYKLILRFDQPGISYSKESRKYELPFV